MHQINHILTELVKIIYDFIIFVYTALISIAAIFKNQKARLWINGRKNWENEIKKSLANAGEKRIWFHCASLGEFEQGRPLIEKLKLNDPSIFIILSFFSPSGFEVRKNFPQADLVCYLPSDKKRNALKFISILSPSYVVFIKYEFWIHYFEELKKREIPLYIVSAIFRPTQLFFKWYGSFYRNALKNVHHFFVQDNNSADLLNSIGYNNTSITGDTRFDRVKALVEASKKIVLVEKFQTNGKLLVAGSTWPEDEDILLMAIQQSKLSPLKLIIAPHEVSEKRISDIIRKASVYFKKEEITRYSKPENPESARVLIIDNIGMLSSIYGYATIAWLGGGFGKGIHNILEAAAYGLPVIFGPNYKKFREANDLVSLQGAFTINNANDATELLTVLLTDEIFLKKCSKVSSEYVQSQVGATEKIISLLPDLYESAELNRNSH